MAIFQFHLHQEYSVTGLHFYFRHLHRPDVSVPWDHRPNAIFFFFFRKSSWVWFSVVKLASSSFAWSWAIMACLCASGQLCYPLLNPISKFAKPQLSFWLNICAQWNMFLNTRGNNLKHFDYFKLNENWYLPLSWQTFYLFFVGLQSSSPIQFWITFFRKPVIVMSHSLNRSMPESCSTLSIALKFRNWFIIIIYSVVANYFSPMWNCHLWVT